jgi:hypothetical protein
MFIRSTPLGIRASATARARSVASVPEVWALLADPHRWTDFHPCLGEVTVCPDGDVPAEAGLSAGQRLRVGLRLLPVSLPVEVTHVVERSSLALSVRLLPGLVEELEHLVMPSVAGGTVLTVRMTLHGPLALPAVAPRWVVRALTTRLLARAADAQLGASFGAISSVA